MAHRALRPTVRSVLASAALVAAVAACDAYTALGPSGPERIVLTYAGASAIAAGDTVPLAVVAERNGAPLDNPRLEITSSDPDVLSVLRSNRLLVGRRRGNVTLTIRLVSAVLPGGGVSLVQPLRVRADALALSPAGLTFSSVGDTLTVAATALDANGATLAGVPVEWTSSDTGIATIDARGLVRARGNGTAELRARIPDDSLAAAVPVSVTQRVQQLAFEPAAFLFDALGAEATLAITARDAKGNTVPTTAFTFESCNPSIVSVSLAGLVRAVGNGRTCVTATSGDVSGTLPVEVNQRAARIEVRAPSGLTIPALGGELQLTAIAFDRLNVPVSDAPLRWFSRDPGIAQVDTASGRVRGVGLGDAPIVAAMDDTAGTATVSVRNLAASVAVRPSSATMTSVGDTILLAADVHNALGDPIIGSVLAWRSTDPIVAEVLADGRVVARSAGTARVIVAADALADTASITVRNDPAFVDITVPADSLRWIGASKALPVVVRNARGDTLPASSLSWSSADAAVVRVSSTGLITAVGEGETYVRAQSDALGDSVRVFVSNRPASITVNASADTLTAFGQSTTYAAAVVNGGGAPLPAYPVTWSSSNPGVVRVEADGRATATGYGSTLVIARADTAADTIRVVVTNPTRLYVDNAIVTTEHFGTGSRPYLRIQDALLAADAFDTVFVRRGAVPYDETVVLNRRVTLLGDSTAFVSGGRDPRLLPLVAHDTGSVGIRAYTTAPVEIRYLGIRHSLDGWALDVDGANVLLEHVHVNPAGDAFATGRGIQLVNVPSVADLRMVTVHGVRAAGIRLVNVRGARLADVTVREVLASQDHPGHGIEVSGGRGAQITRATVRTAAGAQILLDSTESAVVSASDLAGESQLLRARNVVGSTIVENSRFDTSRLPGDPFTGNSETDGRSGLEVRAAGGVLVRNNDFVNAARAASLMDAVRLIDARGTTYGVRFQDNRFNGGRHGVRSERSRWEMSASRADSMALPLKVSAGDTASLASVRLAVAPGGCVNATDAVVSATGLQLEGCGTLTMPGVVTTRGRLAIEGASILGGGGRAIYASDAVSASVRNATIVSIGGATAGATGRGVIELAGANVEAVLNAVRGFTAHAGIDVNAILTRVDSNRVSENMYGLRFARYTASNATRNDIFDNVLAGVINDQAAPVSASDDWWGDGRGHEGGSDPDAVGDVAIGASTSPLRATAVFPGAAVAALRMVRGGGQVGTPNVALPRRFTVRVVDAAGKPVSGTAVLFEVLQGGKAIFENGQIAITSTSNGSGLAEARLTITRSAESISVRASTPGAANTLTFTATTP